MEEEREPLFFIVQQTFGLLGTLVNQAVSVETPSAYQMLYLISKIFYITN